MNPYFVNHIILCNYSFSFFGNSILSKVESVDQHLEFNSNVNFSQHIVHVYIYLHMCAADFLVFCYLSMVIFGSNLALMCLLDFLLISYIQNIGKETHN